MGWLWRRRLHASVCVAVVLGACAVTDRRPGLLDAGRRTDSVGPKPGDDLDSGTESDAARVESDASATADPCAPDSPPRVTDRPSATDADDLEDIYLGLTQVTLGTAMTAPASDALGLDLDGTCTRVPDCPGDSAGSCRAQTKRVPADASACRDNALTTLLSVANQITEIGPQFGLSDDRINCGLRSGAFNVLSRIQGYNGRRDDPDVRIDWYAAGASKQFETATCSDGSAPAQPVWDRSAHWEVDSSELTEPAAALARLPDSHVFDSKAYVRDGVLISRMPDGALLRLNGGGSPYHAFALRVHGAFWLGRLGKAQDGSWRMTRGLIAGSTKLDELVQALRETGFCDSGDGDLAYSFMLTFIHESADLLGSGETDPTRACDALSFGIGFEAQQATPAGGKSLEPRVECCAPGKPHQQCVAACGDGIVSGNEKCDTAIAAGLPGACPTVCSPLAPCMLPVLSGTGCDAECMPVTISMAGPIDGCCPDGADATTDRDCKPRCGNTVVETGESCDPSSACTPCYSDNPCLAARTTGSADLCNLRCELVPITQCRNGDACCAASCSSTNDQDCSSNCGNARIDANETCEANTSAPCPASCDDGVACTKDFTSGSAANCNLTCAHVAITTAANDDGCCPTGASANNDSDCEAKCGNRAVESGEECDDGNMTAGDGCVDCKTESQQDACTTILGVHDACTQCKCSKCTAQFNACYRPTVASDAMLCDDLVQCGERARCGNPDCYCGDASLLLCLTGATNGPCREETMQAAKTSTLLDIQSRSTDTNFPIGRANAFRDCSSANCASECSGE
jgi:cysteine-rich repeat protein